MHHLQLNLYWQGWQNVAQQGWVRTGDTAKCERPMGMMVDEERKMTHAQDCNTQFWFSLSTQSINQSIKSRKNYRSTDRGRCFYLSKKCSPPIGGTAYRFCLVDPNCGTVCRRESIHGALWRECARQNAGGKWDCW